MFPNAKGSELVAILATLDPSSQAAGTATTAWISLANHQALMAIIQTGVLGTAATVDAKLRQATDASGTGAKDVPGKAITQLVKASHDNKQAIIECRADDVDTNGGFTHVALSVTVGAAASQISAVLLGTNTRYLPASDFDDGDVVQIV